MRRALVYYYCPAGMSGRTSCAVSNDRDRLYSLSGRYAFRATSSIGTYSGTGPARHSS